MKLKNAAMFMGLIIPVSLSWSACATTISGIGLASLKYSPNGGVAQYVTGTPGAAQLFTTDSGLCGGDPTVFVQAANVGLSSLGTLGTLNASYDLLGTPTGPSGTQPYWLTYLNAPGGGYIGIVSFGGPDLNGSSLIHVFYYFAWNPLTSDNHWGDTLAQLDDTAYGTTTFGQLEVYETGVEIGDWNNGAIVIPANAEIDSITVNDSIAINVPDMASSASLLGLVLFTLAVFGLRQDHLRTVK